MIRIRIDEQGVEIKGHAGAAAAGQDPVCAAISALCYALALNVRAEGHVSEGDTELRWIGLNDAERAVVDAVGRTMDAIAAQEPEYVALEDLRQGGRARLVPTKEGTW